MKKYPTYKELLDKCKQLELEVDELNEELDDAYSTLEEINKEASYQYDNYRGDVQEFNIIKRLSRI